jgi:hypothetical protein
MSQRLVEAVRRQRGALAELLREAGVPPTDAENPGRFQDLIRITL